MKFAMLQKTLCGAKEFAYRLRRQKASFFGFLSAMTLVAVSVFAPFITRYDPTEMNSDETLLPPSLKHPFGSDELGRDVLTRIIYGGRISLFVSLTAVAIALAVGIPGGLISGYYSNSLIDHVIMRLTDILLAFPFILLALVVVVMLGRGMVNVAIALGIAYSPTFVRMMRGSVLSEKEKEYVEAAKSIGMRRISILLGEIFPNSIAPVVVIASQTIAYAILAEAALSFLGLGTMPPQPSWGLMISSGRTFLQIASWISIFPGLFCAITSLSFAIFGDGLNTMMNPKLRK